MRRRTIIYFVVIVFLVIVFWGLLVQLPAWTWPVIGIAVYLGKQYLELGKIKF